MFAACLYPRKGAIREGSDADIVIWDQSRSSTVTASDDLSKADHSVYEGWKVRGGPVTTIRRGEIVYESGRVTAGAGTGLLLPRERWRV
jgi:dihydropyrimidinase